MADTFSLGFVKISRRLPVFSATHVQCNKKPLYALPYRVCLPNFKFINSIVSLYQQYVLKYTFPDCSRTLKNTTRIDPLVAVLRSVSGSRSVKYLPGAHLYKSSCEDRWPSKPRRGTPQRATASVWRDQSLEVRINTENI